MAKTAREQMAELEAGYKAKKKTLGKQVRADEAKELSGLFDNTLNQAVEALRASVTSGLGIYHRNLKAVVVRVSVDAKGVTTLKNTIRTIRMTPAEIKVWDEAHPVDVEPTPEELEAAKEEIEAEEPQELQEAVA
ncbi:MAG: hypothetical protein FVQ79_07470 [Planctomycetes bacterium]|nr:hypothetical protein [Planctomycetota bacterium]